MKKLCMMLAALAVAVVANAAYVDWTASGLSDYKNGSFYLFDSAKSTAVLSALAAVDSTTATTLKEMSLANGTAIGTVTVRGKANMASVDLGTSTSVFALVMKGTEFAADVGYITITEDVSSMIYTPPATPDGKFASTIATAGTTGIMKANSTPTPTPGPSDTPEPTSALLMLVGGSLLALRRKQK